MMFSINNMNGLLDSLLDCAEVLMSIDDGKWPDELKQNRGEVLDESINNLFYQLIVRRNKNAKN